MAIEKAQQKACEKAEKEAICPAKKKEEKVSKKVQKKEEKAKKRSPRQRRVSSFSHKTKSSNALVLIKAHSGCWDTLPPTLRSAHARDTARA